VGGSSNIDLIMYHFINSGFPAVHGRDEEGKLLVDPEEVAEGVRQVGRDHAGEVVDLNRVADDGGVELLGGKRLPKPLLSSPAAFWRQHNGHPLLKQAVYK